MRFKLAVIVTALMLISVLTIPAKAFDIRNGGLAVGISGNFSKFKTKGSETEGNSSNTNGEVETSDIATVSKEIDFASLFAEYNIRGDDLFDGWIGLTIGLEWIPGESTLGARSRSDTAGTFAGPGEETATYKAEAELSDHMSLYVEPTFYAGDYLGVYGKAGVSRVNVRTLEQIAAGTDSSAYEDKDVWGQMFGLGIRATSIIGAFIKLEYSVTDYGDLTFVSTSGNKNTITATPDQNSMRMMLGWMF